MKVTRLAALFGLSSLLASTALAQTPVAPKPGIEKVGHIIVFYLENRAFDNLYGLFPGANGLANAGAAATQVDKDGKPYDKLPPVLDTSTNPPKPDPRFPADLPNGPFKVNDIVSVEEKTGDLVHRFYNEQLQIDGGKMDKYVAYSDASSLVMNYYDGSKLPLWNYAKQYVLMDNFFHAAFGGSFLNHFWLVCACSPRWDNAPDKFVAKLDDKGNLISDGQVTPDGYAVNTSFSVYQPHPAKFDADKSQLVPPQDMPNIGDRLSEKNVSWAWYSGGWNDAVAGHPAPLFQFHHQPFAYFKNYGDGTPGRAAHLKDYLDLVNDIRNNTLPQVVFYKPIGELNEHNGYANVLDGDQHVVDLIEKIQATPAWNDSVIIVTYDENGGLWDHVAPPKTDKWGPGTRIPTLLISPLAKKGFVDHTEYDTTSILKLIETRYGLVPLGTRDAAVNDMTNALDLQ
ncbi:alkaline phosphatase family protein [Methylovirgula sp. 4M-Z18]|uniref:alkaline phosphatase family protein n=1 Tax=Methylovirgula sp. 4M-Z18 TaxID=2293567 RepID=UPI000E2E7CFD|nr:alkaline phosphatase family protein [Methylovirgula sp. 4M-Z18]RFB79129.1 acid phosphatase [Methylovirgula sp. 4M-Z18]